MATPQSPRDPDPQAGGARVLAGEKTRASGSRLGTSSGDQPTMISGEEPHGAEDTSSLVGARIEGYQLVEEIYRGGQGVVFRAVQLGTKRQVALKVLLEGRFAGSTARRRFEREVELAASLHHPNIVTILDSGVSEGRFYFAMEFIDGLRLDRYLAQVQPPLNQTLELLAQVCTAVNFAHQRGVIHRDLKPSNILIDAEGQPHILDFGLAKPVREARSDQTTVQMLSNTGQILGTVAYMSPEQAAGNQDVDVRTDVYSLGVVFYEALLGQPPYTVTGPLAEVLKHIAETDPINPRSLRTNSRFGFHINDELETILLKALDKDPTRRYQTAGDLGRDLRHLIFGEPIEAKRASGFYMFKKMLRRYRIQAAFAATILVMLIGFLIAFAFLYSRERDASQKAEQARVRANADREAAVRSREQETAAREELQRAMVRQRIQRGDVALAQKDLVDARDTYWDAYESDGGAGALWGLRQYYLTTGDNGARLLYLVSTGQNVETLSPDGALGAYSETRDAVAVRQIRTGKVIGWYALPSPPVKLRLDNAGNLVAAGEGWIRAWRTGNTVPFAGILPTGALPQNIDDTSDESLQRKIAVAGLKGGEFVTLVSNARAHVYRTADGLLTTLVLKGAYNGGIDLSSHEDVLAIATTAGVEVLSVDEKGALSLSLAWAADAPRGTESHAPSAVRFSDDDQLAALTPQSVFFGPVRPKDEDWMLYNPSGGDWDFFDLRRKMNSIALGKHDGTIELIRDDQPLPFNPRLTLGELKAMRLSPDGRSLVTLDGRGTVTDWLIDHREQSAMILNKPRNWAVSTDGSTALLADVEDQVILYAPGRPQSRVSLGRRPFTASGALSLAVNADGSRAAISYGDRVRVIESGARAASVNRPFETLAVKLISLSGPGDLLAVYGEDSRAQEQQIQFFTWRRAPGATRPELVPQPVQFHFGGSAVRQMEFIPGSKNLLLARSNGDLTLLNPEAGDTSNPAASKLPLAWVTLDALPECFTLARDGKQVVVACDDQTLAVLRLADKTTMVGTPVDAPVTSVSLNASGEVLMVRTRDGALQLFELASRERIMRVAYPPGDANQPFGAWLGAGDAMLVSSGNQLFEYRYNQTDDLIAKNQPYARQRHIARALAAGDFEGAWALTERLTAFDPEILTAARESILAAMLRRPAATVPADWLTALMAPDAPLLRLERMGQAAYDGLRFSLARDWLKRAGQLAGGELDAQTILRIAQCNYVMEDYSAAVNSYSEWLKRPDVDSAILPLVQLQYAAALYFAGNSAEAAKTVRNINATRPAGNLFYAGNWARQIGAQFLDLPVDNPLGRTVENLASLLRTEGSQTYQDDVQFFDAEKARKAGRLEEAAAAYQRCIDLASDRWPANWAHARLAQIVRKPL